MQWLTIEKGRSRATTDAYQRDLHQLGEWMGTRRLTLDRLTDELLERYFSELRASGRAASSVARAVSSVRGWLRYLTEEQYVANDPSSRLRGGRRGRTLPKPLSEETIMALLDSLPTLGAVNLRDQALLELLYGTGARVSEAVGISVDDLDFDEELIRVTGKGARQRLVPMGATLHRVLRHYLAPGGRSQLLGTVRTSSLFLNTRGGQLTRQGVDLIIHKRALVAGIDRATISAHVFRHSCATHMLAHGADIRVVQELLGHASIATTQIYTAVSITSLQREYHNAHPRAHD